MHAPPEAGAPCEHKRGGHQPAAESEGPQTLHGDLQGVFASDLRSVVASE